MIDRTVLRHLRDGDRKRVYRNHARYGVTRAFTLMTLAPTPLEDEPTWPEMPTRR